MDTKAPDNLLPFPTPTSDETTRLLTALKGYGDVTLMCLGFNEGGWICILDAKINAVGASMKIKSDGHHQDPKEAIKECQLRLQDTLRQFNGAANLTNE